MQGKIRVNPLILKIPVQTVLPESLLSEPGFGGLKD